MLSPLYKFLDRFGEPLAQRVAQTFQILHDPLRDAGTTPAYDAALAALPRTCYPAQAEAAKALAKAFFVAGDRGVHLCGEMGTGKTTVALALLALAPQPLRVLVMCPPHLVSKWAREAQAVLPTVRAVPLGGRDALGHLLRLADAIRAHGRIVPSVPEVWILSRERAKLHYAWQPAVWRRRRAGRDPGTPGAPLQTWVEPACCGCGALLQDPDGLPLTDVQLHRTHTFCPACGEPAFGPDPQGPRRYAPAEFIKRHLRGVFDLFIPDEVHELKGAATGQGHAYGALAAACGRTLTLTGTLLGGYADNLFHVLFRANAAALVADGFQYRNVQAWMARYGILEKITRLGPHEDDCDARTVRGKTRAVSLRRKPGISPLVLGRHLLPHSIFLRLADVADALPPYEERVVSLAMSPDLARAYHGLADALLKEVREALAAGSRHLLAAYLQSLLCYPDQAAFREETVVDPHTQQVIAHAPIVSGPLPKEEELVEVCRKEVQQEGRRVLVYVTFTETRDLTPRIAELLTAAGLRVAVLKGSVEAARREAWIQERLAAGLDVLVCNPELVKTGLDLLEMPTMVYLCPGYSIYTLRQAARRAWRIGQTAPCRVIFLTYRGTMQDTALKLIATKLEASLAIEGELGTEGLGVLADPADSLVLELARALVHRVGGTESAEAVWARLRKRDLEQLLTLTTMAPAPPITAISASLEQIGNRLLIVDLIEHTHPRRKKTSRIEVTADSLQDILADRPHLAQLALF
jgi:hypothetical protein